jgi:hypothetical protein
MSQDKIKLETTTNNLLDIINWLKAGHIICIYTQHRKRFFFKEPTLNEITDEYIIYINVLNHSSLLDEGEWSYYIMRSGFHEYLSVDVLPTHEDKILKFSLKY